MININNENKELITVIMPVYNGEKFIKTSLESIIHQTYDNLEILVIDDGSDDRTPIIIDEYEKTDSRIRVIHQTNRGRGFSRNVGLQEARGEFIAFCDADDKMRSDMIEKMYLAFNEDIDIVICNFRFVDSSGKELHWAIQKLHNGIESGMEALSRFLITTEIEGFCWNKLARKKLYFENKLFFDEEKESFEEIKTNARLILCARKVGYVDDQLYDYYQRDSSCIHTMNLKKNEAYVEVIKNVSSLSLQVGLVKQTEIYKVNRINKLLFDMYKEKENYKKSEFDNFFIETYGAFLEIPFIKKLYYAIHFPIDNVFKFIIKEWVVMKTYRSMVLVRK